MIKKYALIFLHLHGCSCSWWQEGSGLSSSLQLLSWPVLFWGQLEACQGLSEFGIALGIALQGLSDCDSVWQDLSDCSCYCTQENCLTTANGFSSDSNHRSLSGVDSTRRPSNPRRSTTFENKVWTWTWHRTSSNRNLSDCGIRSNFDCFVAGASQGGTVHPQETSRPEGGQASQQTRKLTCRTKNGKLNLGTRRALAPVHGRQESRSSNCSLGDTSTTGTSLKILVFLCLWLLGNLFWSFR